MSKKLVLHAGMGKTGSSALQVAFVRNRQRLLELGIDYPEHETDTAAIAGKVVSGNGMALRDWLVPRPHDRDRERQRKGLHLAQKTVEASSAQAVLYSSEFLYGARPRRLRVLAEAVAESGVDIEVIVYVRDNVGHALSAYSQIVKRSLFTGSMADSLAPSGPYRLSLRPQLESLVETVGREKVRVLHYDSCRDRLFEGLLRDIFDIEDLTGLDLGHGQVNRSLTRHEIEMMRLMNTRLHGKVAARRASDALIARPPLGDPGTRISEAEVRLLESRFADDVAWVNETFLMDGVLDVIGSAAVVPNQESPAQLGEAEVYLLECLADVANR